MKKVTKFWHRLGFRLSLVFLLLTSLPLALTGYLAFTNGRQVVEQHVFNHLVSTSQIKASQLEQWILENESDLEFMAQRPLVQQEAQRLTTCQEGACQEIAERLLAEHFDPAIATLPSYLALTLIRGEDGQILVSTEKEFVGMYRENETYFTEGLVATYTDDVSYFVTHGEAAMHVSTPVYGPEGAVQAVLVAHLNLEEISEIMEQRSGRSGSEDTYLVNAFNFFVTEPRFGEDFALKKAVHTQGVNDCLAGDSGIDFYPDYREVPVIGAYQWLPKHELCILTEVDVSEAFAPIAAFGRTILWIGLVNALVVAILGLFFARSITKPVHTLVDGAREIGRGNLDHEIEPQGYGEISQLAQAFNQMTANLRKSLGETAQSRRTVLALSQAAEDVQRARTSEQVYQTVADEVSKLGHHAIIFSLVDDGTQVVVSHLSIESRLLRTAEKLAGISVSEYRQEIKPGDIYDQAIREKRAVYVTNMIDRLGESLPRATRPVTKKIVNMIGFKRAIYAPLIAAEETYGLLVVASNTLTEADLPAVSTFANQTAIALENTRLLDELKDFNQELEKRVQERTRELQEAQQATMNMMLDVEEARQEVEQAYGQLKHEKKYTDRIINSIPGVFYIFNQDGQFIRWNDNFPAVSGYEDKAFEQIHPLDLFAGAEKEQVAHSIQTVFEDGAATVQANLVTKEGQQIPYYFTGFRMLTEDGPILIGTGVDISERVEAQERLIQKTVALERSNEELEQFAYVASHDLQEPLRMVASYLQLLERRYSQELDSDAREFIEFAVDGATRMKKLINDLLAFSRVGTRGKPFQITDLNAVLGRVRADLNAAMEENNAILTSDELPTLMADETQMGQLFQNLISNAIKFRKQDVSPLVHISAEDQNGEVLLSVRDNGIGIDPQFADRIFVIFQRLHNGQQYTGTGIGLAISKRIVERHGGSIWVESQEGEGATFYFTLPKHQPDQVEQQ